MLNPFPVLLSFSLLAPFILRVAIGFYFLKTGWQHLMINKHTGQEIAVSENKIGPYSPYLFFGIAGLEAICGIALIVGFLTQVASLIMAVLCILAVIFKKRAPEIFRKKISFYILLSAICISLLFSGAGLFAFDLAL